MRGNKAIVAGIVAVVLLVAVGWPLVSYVRASRGAAERARAQAEAEARDART